MIPLWSIPIATITGNTIILKPSEKDPGAVMILVELAEKAGFPPGVINVIHGTKRAVNFILDEPSIKAINHPLATPPFANEGDESGISAAIRLGQRSMP